MPADELIVRCVGNLREDRRIAGKVFMFPNVMQASYCVPKTRLQVQCTKDLRRVINSKKSLGTFISTNIY
jgi:hypothetical protein